MAGLEDAVQELYQVPLAQFVVERKRIAAELKKSGDAAAAKALLARRRPTMSAWVVNQLYWHARDAFDAMLKTANRLREGDLRASGDHRETIATLRRRAATMLADAGHAPNEATLRRVTTTLAALAVSGGFEPDPPGALAEDRDPPGFEAVGIPAMAEAPEETADHKQDHQDHKDELAEARAKAAHKAEQAAAATRESEDVDRRAEDSAEKKREEAERKRIAAERHRLEAALRTAKVDRTEREREVKQLEKQLTGAQKAVGKAQELVDDIENKLAELATDA